MEEKNLPKEWIDCDLNELLDYVTSGSRDWSQYYSDKGVNFIRTQDINQNRLDLSSVAKVTLPEKVEGKRTLVLENDILITITGANVGKCARVDISPPESYVSQSVALVRLVNPSMSAFIQRQIIAPVGDQTALQKAAYGMGRPVLNLNNIRDFKVKLPPLAEQEVIAEKLDNFLAQVDNTKARLERIPEILKSFRQSVLSAAVSGKLSEEWRSNASIEPRDYSQIAIEERKLKGIRETKHSKIANTEEIPFEIPDSWQWFRLGNLALKITDGAHNTPKVLNEGFPYIMAKDLTVGFLDFSEKRYISEKEHRELYLKCVPERDDLLVVNIGAGTGNNVLVDVDFEFSFKNIAIIKRPSFIIGKYLKCFFDSQKQRIFDEQTRGGAQPFLSLTVLNELAFALPSREEQTEIVRRVEQLFAFADSIEQRANAALARVNNLTQSILAKAFRGELTADWRIANPDLISGDNSAEALLAKIKAERANLVKKAKAKA